MTTNFERLMEKATPRATRLVKVMGGLDMCDVRELDLAMCVSPSSNGSKMRSLWTNQMKS